MKSLADSIGASRKRRSSKWIPGGVADASISKAQADRFTDGLLKIGARIDGLPSDMAMNHDHYLHGLAKK